MKDIKSFIELVGGKPVDYDGEFGMQCMDLVREYWKYMGQPQVKKLGWRGVKYLAIMNTTFLVKGQQYIKNNPKDINQTPPIGCAIIFNKPSATGHIAIVVDAPKGVNSIKIYEQNYGSGNGHGRGNNAPRIRTTTYKDVMGRIIAI